jgi:hypothetical protein
MSFHRIGVAASLVVICVGGTFVTQAHACDSRIAGSCPGAPIISPSSAVAVAAETPAADSAEKATRKSVRKRHSSRSRRHHHRRRHVVTPRQRPTKQTHTADTGESTRGVDFKTRDLKGLSRGIRSENFGIADPAPSESWANVPVKLASPLPTPLPLPRLASPPVQAPSQANADSPASVDAGQPASAASASSAARSKLVATKCFKPPAETAGADEQAVRTPAPASKLTALRAMILAFAGLLAVGTAVRMVV